MLLILLLQRFLLVLFAEPNASPSPKILTAELQHPTLLHASGWGLRGTRRGLCSTTQAEPEQVCAIRDVCCHAQRYQASTLHSAHELQLRLPAKW